MSKVLGALDRLAGQAERAPKQDPETVLVDEIIATLAFTRDSHLRGPRWHQWDRRVRAMESMTRRLSDATHEIRRLREEAGLARDAYTALAQLRAPVVTEGYWWCPECMEEVPSSHVTIYEFHKHCGRTVRWIEPLPHLTPTTPEAHDET